MQALRQSAAATGKFYLARRWGALAHTQLLFLSNWPCSPKPSQRQPAAARGHCEVGQLHCRWKPDFSPNAALHVADLVSALPLCCAATCRIWHATNVCPAPLLHQMFSQPCVVSSCACHATRFTLPPSRHLLLHPNPFFVYHAHELTCGARRLTLTTQAPQNLVSCDETPLCQQLAG